MAKNIGAIILALGSILVIVVGVMNGAAVQFNLLGAHFGASDGALLIGGYVLGVLFSFALLASRYSKKAESGKRLEEWQAQDEKLSKQVQSDREKQLEAKIATLESALQKALKR